MPYNFHYTQYVTHYRKTDYLLKFIKMRQRLINLAKKLISDLNKCWSSNEICVP